MLHCRNSSDEQTGRWIARRRGQCNSARRREANRGWRPALTHTRRQVPPRRLRCSSQAGISECNRGLTEALREKHIIDGELNRYIPDLRCSRPDRAATPVGVPALPDVRARLAQHSDPSWKPSRLYIPCLDGANFVPMPLKRDILNDFRALSAQVAWSLAVATPHHESLAEARGRLGVQLALRAPVRACSPFPINRSFPRRAGRGSSAKSNSVRGSAPSQQRPRYHGRR
jgi:hypothetical protein